MDKKQYVLCFVRNENSNKFIVLEKEKPKWQEGLLNLPGGKIEQGETPYFAALRELQEEAGIIPFDFNHAGMIVGEDFEVYVFAGWNYGFVKLKTVEYEQCEWMFISELIFNKSGFLPNLRVIIPLLMNNIYGWTITDREDSNRGKPHTFSITI